MPLLYKLISSNELSEVSNMRNEEVDDDENMVGAKST